MKKIISVCMALVLMLCAAVPVYGAEAPEILRDEVYYKATYSLWEADCHQVGSTPKTYEEFCANYYSDPDYFFFKYLGAYGDGEATVWVFGNHTPGVRWRFLGDYWISDGCVMGDIEPGLTVYYRGEFYTLWDGYEQGIIDADDLAALCLTDPTIGCGKGKDIRRIGDMNGDNRLDVGDIMEMKQELLAERSLVFNLQDFCYYGDFDRNGCMDVGDIMGLKNHIMSK